MNGALWNEISAYVASVTIDRDDSHGHAHMQEVAWLSMDISRCLHQKGLSCPSTKELVMCVAWLHDVSDHKYDPEGKMRQQTIDFLSKHHMDTTLIMNIIDLISYSREVSDRQHEDYRQRWEKLLGVDGLLIRDIVSDADKSPHLELVDTRDVQTTFGLETPAPQPSSSSQRNLLQNELRKKKRRMGWKWKMKRWNSYLHFLALKKCMTKSGFTPMRSW
jgi:hypothetical protein